MHCTALHTRPPCASMLQACSSDWCARLLKLDHLHGRQVMAGHAVACHAVVVAKAGAIRKTTSGKVQRRACRQAFMAGDFSQARSFHATAQVLLVSQCCSRTIIGCSCTDPTIRCHYNMNIWLTLYSAANKV